MAAASEEDARKRHATPDLHKTGLFGDVVNTMQRPRAGLPMYRHCVPRTPIALQDAVFASKRVQDAITKVRCLTLLTPSLLHVLAQAMRGRSSKRRQEPS